MLYEATFFTLPLILLDFFKIDLSHIVSLRPVGFLFLNFCLLFLFTYLFVFSIDYLNNHFSYGRHSKDQIMSFSLWYTCRSLSSGLLEVLLTYRLAYECYALEIAYLRVNFIGFNLLHDHKITFLPNCFPKSAK